MVKIAAGIVLYNPKNDERFKRAFNSVIKEFNKIYVFDNSTTNIQFSFNSTKVVYMTEDANRGIAYALNHIMKAADKDNYDWVVTMDQDSIIPHGLLKAYKENLSVKELGIICPQAIDKRRTYELPKSYPKKEYVNKCITSGSCTSVRAWKKVGGFDNKLFIDLVDNDFCKRIILSKYKILKLNNIILDQEFGEIIPKSSKKQQFWYKIAQILNNINFAKLGYKKKVSAFRVYYTNRNIIYLNKKLKKFGGIGYQSYNTTNYFGFWIAFNLPSILRGDNKLEIIKSVYKGIKDGKNEKVNEWKPR